MTTGFQVYNVFVGLLSVVGLVYLAYSQRFVVGYRRFLDLLIVGFLIFSVGGPIVDLFQPSMTHAVHGIAALFVILGLYDPVHNDLRKNEWAELLWQDPSDMRHPGEWMVPMDDEILELFHSAELVLTPTIIAFNIDHSREEINRRLTELTERRLVDRVERGKYRITELGEQYLQGQLYVALLESQD